MQCKYTVIAHYHEVMLTLLLAQPLGIPDSVTDKKAYPRRSQNNKNHFKGRIIHAWVPFFMEIEFESNETSNYSYLLLVICKSRFIDSLA
jgi:hypothetical protein